MPDHPKYSRWRRLPGAYWITERRPSDPRDEPERLTLYLPGRVLDQAEALAARAGARSVQDYCEALLARVLDEQAALGRLEEVEARRGALEGLDEIANDPDYLAEFAASSLPRGADDRATAPERPAPMTEPTSLPPREGAAEVVVRHAAIGPEDPDGLIACLRRGEPVGPEPARALLQALLDLERELRDADRIGRRLAYALHRLAFEGQVLLTDAWPAGSADAATVDLLRIVQESVDRVLSGEDIRYYDRGPDAEPPP